MTDERCGAAKCTTFEGEVWCNLAVGHDGPHHDPVAYIDWAEAE